MRSLKSGVQVRVMWIRGERFSVNLPCSIKTSTGTWVGPIVLCWDLQIDGPVSILLQF